MKKYIATILLSLAYGLLSCTVSVAQSFDSANIHNSESDNSNPAIAVPQADTVLERFAFESSFDSVRAFKSRKDFRYMRYLDSLLKKTKGLTIDTISLTTAKGVKMKRHLLSSSSDEKGHSIFNTSLVRTLFWILAIFFIVFILYKLFLTESIFRKTPGVHNATSQPHEETAITPSTYEKLINEATANKDFRSAIRYLYLQTLQILSIAGLIQMSPDKTNYEYVQELSGRIHQDEFASLTLNYEYVWYGKFNIEHETFNRLLKGFKQYHQKIIK